MNIQSMMIRQIVAIGALLAAKAGVFAQSLNPVTIDTTFGQVTGISSDDGVDSFLGIKFANVGERFSRSSLIETQSEPVNATSYGPYCYQAFFEGMGDLPPLPQDEDCLYLNIWRPSNATSDSSLSTMVWIHGGGFIFGSGAEELYNGANLAREDVVVVTLNYRLGLFGSLVTDNDGTGGLNGIDDQINGLKWVKNHIASFGGNPDDVTIFGESAGSISVCIISISPLAKGLFHRAIQQSGECVYSPAVVPRDAAFGVQQTEFMLNLTGAASVADLTSATSFPAIEIAPLSGMANLWWLTVDGLVLTNHPSQLYADSNNINPTDMIIGSTSYDDPFVLLLPPEVYVPLSFTMNDGIEGFFGPEAGGAIIEAYSPDKYNDNQVAAYSQYSGDFYIRCATRAFANMVSGKLSGKAFLYNYAYLSSFDPVILNGLYESEGIDDITWATHAAEVPMVFNNLEGDLFGFSLPDPTEDDLAVSAELLSRWVNFAKTGDPNSDEYSGWEAVSQEAVPPGRATSVPTFVLQLGGSEMSTVEEKVEQCSTFPFVVEASSAAPTPTMSTPEPTMSSSAHVKVKVTTTLLMACMFLWMV